MTGRLRSAVEVGLGSLRVYWAHALIVVGLGAGGLAALVPVRSLARASDVSQPLMSLPAVPPADAALPSTTSLIQPDAFQARAVSDLYLLLLILAWCAMIVAGISMLTRFSALAAVRGAEVGIRRAAGASRKDLLLAFASEGWMLLVAVVALGLPAAAALLFRWTGEWPGPVATGPLVPWSALALVASLIGIGVLLPLRYASARRVTALADGEVRLGVPAFQLALSLAILIGGSSLLRQAPGVQDRSGGPGNPAIFELDAGSEPPESRARTLGAMIQALEQSPGVRAVSAASPGTLLGLGSVDDATTDCGMCVRGQIIIRYQLVTARHHEVSAGTFGLHGVSVLSGRSFSRGDTWDAPRVAIVSRHLAVTAFERGEAVGRDLFLGHDWPKRPYRVIGVVDDVVPTAMGGALQPLDTIYLHVLQHPPRTVELAVEGLGDTALLAAARPLGSAREILAAPAQPVRWFGGRFALAGVVVLLAALVGTFGTMRMWVQSCTADLAARRAVGATRIRIVAWVLWHTAGTGVKGVLAGLFLYFSVLQVSLTSLLGKTPGLDLALIGALAALLLAAATLGAALPTVRLLRRPIATLFQ
jgi:putative ABC transport system permease protein